MYTEVPDPNLADLLGFFSSHLNQLSGSRKELANWPGLGHSSLLKMAVLPSPVKRHKAEVEAATGETDSRETQHTQEPQVQSRNGESHTPPPRPPEHPSCRTRDTGLRPPSPAWPAGSEPRGVGRGGSCKDTALRPPASGTNWWHLEEEARPAPVERAATLHRADKKGGTE